jgi:hypothetical protein
MERSNELMVALTPSVAFISRIGTSAATDQIWIKNRSNPRPYKSAPLRPYVVRNLL